MKMEIVNWAAILEVGQGCPPSLKLTVDVRVEIDRREFPAPCPAYSRYQGEPAFIAAEWTSTGWRISEEHAWLMSNQRGAYTAKVMEFVKSQFFGWEGDFK